MYWRRRFFVLVAGLGMVALLFWAFSGPGGGQHSSATARTSGAAQPGGGAGGPVPAAYGSTAASPPAGDTASPSASPSASVSPSASPSASAGKDKNAGKDTSTAAKAKGRPAPCPAADIVLSLFTSKTSYSAHETPEFRIDVVSTDAAACTFGTGPADLHLVIKSGSSVVWDSAACPHSAGTRAADTQAVTLQRGVPASVPVTWDRLLSSHGCGSRQDPARSGTYVAVAESIQKTQDGTLDSQPLTFGLR